MLFADGDYSLTINISAWAAGIISSGIVFVGKLFHGYIKDNQQLAVDGKKEFKEMLVANTVLTREVATALVTGAGAVEKLADEMKELKVEVRGYMIGGNSVAVPVK